MDQLISFDDQDTSNIPNISNIPSLNNLNTITNLLDTPIPQINQDVLEYNLLSFNTLEIINNEEPEPIIKLDTDIPIIDKPITMTNPDLEDLKIKPKKPRRKEKLPREKLPKPNPKPKIIMTKEEIESENDREQFSIKYRNWCIMQEIYNDKNNEIENIIVTDEIKAFQKESMARITEKQKAMCKQYNLLWYT